MVQAILRFVREEDGPTAVEYAVMLAMIVMAAFAAIASIGTEASTLWQTINVSAFDAGLGHQ